MKTIIIFIQAILARSFGTADQLTHMMNKLHQTGKSTSPKNGFQVQKSIFLSLGKHSREHFELRDQLMDDFTDNLPSETSYDNDFDINDFF